jgi:hypothetical protein
MMSTRRLARTWLAVSLAVGGMAVWFAAPAAAARWAGPRNLFPTAVSSVGYDYSFNRPAVDVAIDGAGNAIAAWVQQVGATCQAKWAYRPAGRAWSAPHNLSAAMAFCPYPAGLKLAMNRRGSAVVAWLQTTDTYNVDVAVRPPGGSFGPVQRVSAGAESLDPWASINAGGVAAVSWVGRTGTGPYLFHASVRPAGGSFGPVETVTEPPADYPSVWTPRLAVGPGGDVTAVWVGHWYDAGYHGAIEEAYRPAGGTFPTTPSQRLREFTYTSQLYQYGPDIAVDAQGRATAVWVYNTGTHRVIESAAKVAGAATFGAKAAVNPADSGDAFYPRVAVDPATNTAVAAWLQCETSCRVRAAARPNGASFGQLQTLSGLEPAGSYPPVVGFDSSGVASVAWGGRLDEAPPDRVLVAVRPKSGPFQPAAVISGPAGTANDNGPALALDRHGNRLVVWQHVTTTPDTVLRYADAIASWYRPDALLKTASATGYAGANVYNSNGTNQTATAGVKRGKSITFDIKVVNRSSATDSFTIKGPGDKQGFAATYLAGLSGGSGITTAVLNGIYTLADVAPGGTKTLRLMITVKPRTALGKSNNWLVTATSTHDTTRKDAVQAVVRVVS